MFDARFMFWTCFCLGINFKICNLNCDCTSHTAFIVQTRKARNIMDSKSKEQ
jgi:hypothetical protein